MQRTGGYLSRPQLYGGFGGFDTASEKDHLFYARGQRQRLNVISVCQCLFLPWFMYCFTYAVTSFDLHYTRPLLMYVLLGLGLLGVVICGWLAFGVAMKKVHHDFHEPSWYIFLFITMAIGWSLGIVFGNLNYISNMQSFYDYQNLNEYFYVDPSRMLGSQLMDAGRVSFVNGTSLDLRRSMGFKNLDTYCVAPITVEGLPLASYDFWAVGLDCCSGNTADFQCGEYDNPKAKAGLRFLKDEQRAFFRLAVQQAEATYGIKATHPLFFFWTQDATGEMQGFRDEGYRYYCIGMVVHFVWQLFCVALAVMGFAKLGRF
jgi:hypothetical protein